MRKNDFYKNSSLVRWSFRDLFHFHQSLLGFVQVIALVCRWVKGPWLDQAPLLVLVTVEFPLNDAALFPLTLSWYLQNLVAECTNENHVWIVFFLDSKKLPFISLFLWSSINTCAVFIWIESQIMPLILVLNIKVKSFSDKCKSLTDTTVGFPIISNFLIVFVIPEINNLIIHLALDRIVFFYEFSLSSNNFLTEIIVHDLQMWSRMKYTETIIFGTYLKV